MYAIPSGSYGSPIVQNWMCELYMHVFSNLVTYIIKVATSVGRYTGILSSVRY